MSTWATILSILYPQLSDLARRLASRQSIPWGNRDALADDALHDACESLLSTVSVPDQITDCQSYAITVLHRAIWRSVKRIRAVLTDGLDDECDQVPAPRVCAWDGIAYQEALESACRAAGERLWPYLAARLDNPGASAGDVAELLGTSPGMVRLSWHKGRQRVALAVDDDHRVA